MDRREFIRKTIGTAAALSALPILNSKIFGQEKILPNVLIIHTDQQSSWTLGAYGGVEVATPNIDSLAKDGATLLNFFTNSPVCTPSRGCFLTGQYPHTHGAYKNDKPLNDNATTFASVLKENGYSTGYAGKWHLDGNRRPGWVHKDRGHGFEDNYYMYNRGHWKKIETAPMKDVEPVVSDYQIIGDEKTYTTDWLTSKAIDFIKTKHEKPFCYMLSIPDPHDPYTVREPYDKMFDENDIIFPDNVPASVKNKTAKVKTQYLGMVKCIDDNVGRIITALKETGIFDDTIIVFTTDHGDYMGEHGLMGKNDIYETAIRIPFIIRYPKKINKGIKIDNIISTIDFMPTLLGLLGIKSPECMQGKDASAFLLGENNKWTNEAYIHHSSLSQAYLFTDEYELALTEKGTKVFLFDRKNDTLQLNNLYDDLEYQTVIEQLKDKIKNHHRQLNTPMYEWLKTIN